MEWRDLIGSELCDFLGAACPRELAALEYQARLFHELRGYGWSPADLAIAAETGYFYQSHSQEYYGRRHPGRYGGYKVCMGPVPLTAWLRHHFRQSKANKAGLEFEEFVALWRRLAAKLMALSLLSTGNRHDRLIDALYVYIKALIFGLDLPEAEEVAGRVFYAGRNKGDIYLLLRRRGIDYDLTVRALACDAVSFGSVKYIVEAHRRGAIDDQIVCALAERRVSKLALSLRRAAREAADAK